MSFHVLWLLVQTMPDNTSVPSRVDQQKVKRSPQWVIHCPSGRSALSPSEIRVIPTSAVLILWYTWSLMKWITENSWYANSWKLERDDERESSICYFKNETFMQICFLQCEFQLTFRAAVPKLFGTRDPFHGRQFFHRTGCRGRGMVPGWFKHITFIVPFISIIITL